jgi:hypothetical protein
MTPGSSQAEEGRFQGIVTSLEHLPEGAVVKQHDIRFSWVRRTEVKSLNLPTLDSTDPDAPEDVIVGGDASSSSDPGAVYVGWGGKGDPLSDDPESDGSGIQSFAIRYRINSGDWSNEVIYPADEEWTYRDEVTSLSEGDKVEFSIASIDGVGHRSDAVTESSSADGPPIRSEAPPGASIDSDVASDTDPDGLLRMRLAGAWSPQKSRVHDSIAVTTDLFDSAVDRNSPGTPIATTSKACADSKSCIAASYLSFSPGKYVTRTHVEVTDASSVVVDRTSWSTESTILDTQQSDVEMPGDAPTAPQDAGPSPGTASIASLSKTFDKCEKGLAAPTQKSYNWDTLFPPKYRCRYGYALGEKGGRKKSGHVLDGAIVDAYAPLNERRPGTLRGSKMVFKFQTDDQYAAHKDGTKVHGWPMMDSLGFTRAWIEYSNKTDQIHIYPVRDSAHPSYANEKFPLQYSKPKVKLQGMACFRPRKIDGLQVPGYGQKKTRKDVSLYVLDFDDPRLKIRLFIPNAAFDADPEKLHETGVGCSSGSVNTSMIRPLGDPALGGSAGAIQFVFKEGKDALPSKKYPEKRKNYDQGKTFGTYNAKSLFETMYAPANTNTVYKGGVSRGSVPYENMKFAVKGFMGYCDANAFTKNYDLPKGNYSQNRMLRQTGMRWAYGEYRIVGADGHSQRSGIDGWVPFSAIDFLQDGPSPGGEPGVNPDGRDATPQDCAYGPTQSFP